MANVPYPAPPVGVDRLPGGRKYCQFFEAVYGSKRNSRLENHIAGRTFYLCTSLEDYFFDAISGLPTYTLPQYKKDKVIKLQDKVSEIKDYYYTKGYKHLALSELKDVFPVP